MDVKKIFKGIVLYLLGASLFFVLFAFAYFTAFSQTTAKPDKVKNILKDSGVYQKAPPVIYDKLAADAPESASDIPLDNPLVRNAALDAFTPGFVQNNVEAVLDGTYEWLEGKAARPEFNTELKNVKNRFAASLSEQVGKRLAKLPPCRPGQHPPGLPIDPYKTACRPAGTDINAIKKQVRRSVAANDDFLNGDTASPAPESGSNNSLFDKNSRFPEAYRSTLQMPYLLAAFAALLSAVIIFISGKAAGLKKLALIFVLAGIFIVFVPLGFRLITDAFIKAASGNNVVTELVAPVLREFNQAAAKVYYVIGAAHLALAIGAYLLFRRFQPPDKPLKKKAAK
ncbi:MAG TPA: hypothetical protein VFX86_03395 [Candidatus Saccharimonadales bacterium]|nr:hypothetical protein [Candidatus Saccharimonadales bacterium]